MTYAPCQIFVKKYQKVLNLKNINRRDLTFSMFYQSITALNGIYFKLKKKFHTFLKHTLGKEMFALGSLFMK